MQLKKVGKESLFRKLVVVLVLSTATLSMPSFGNEFTTASIIPYNYRNFNESDYFSSTINDEELVSQAKQIKLNLPENVPMPSQYNQPQTIIKNNQQSDIPELKFTESTFVPSSEAINFFAPENEVEIKEEVKTSEVNELQVETETVNSPEKSDELLQENLKEEVETPTLATEELTSEGTVVTQNAVVEQPVYEVAVESKKVESDVVEGKSIGKIKVYGLNTIGKDFVMSVINSRFGNLYNEEILEKDLEKIYSTGYFTDNMSVEPTFNPDGTVDLAFTLEENRLVTDIIVAGNEVIETKEILPMLWNLKGKPQNLNKINDSIDKITNYYAEKGYILANVFSVDDDANGSLTFTIREGVINKINITGNERTKDYVIARNIMTEAGTVYNEELLKKDLKSVFATHIFEEVNREIKPSESNDGTYDVTVVVKEKSTNSVGLGGGIDTGLGAFGSVSFREDNFLGRAQRVSLSGIIGSGILLNDASIKDHMNYQVELGFVEPHFINADNSLMSKLYFREMGSWQIPLAIERRIGGIVGVEHKVKRIDGLTTNFVTGVEHIHFKEGDFNKISSLYDRYNLNIADRAKQLDGGLFLNLGPGIKYSKLDNEEIPRSGIIAQARYTEALGLSNFNHTTGRLTGMVTKFFPVFKKSTFSLTAKAGAKIHGDDMPEFMAYKLGGPYTIRGYKMNGVGTGESFFMGSAELATPLPLVDRLKWDFVKRMRLTFFVDAGKVFDPTVTNVLYDRPIHAITAGVGLRVYIPGIGPISVDYGLPITNPGSHGSEHGYFTFGSGGLNGYGLYGY